MPNPSNYYIARIPVSTRLRGQLLYIFPRYKHISSAPRIRDLCDRDSVALVDRRAAKFTTGLDWHRGVPLAASGLPPAYVFADYGVTRRAIARLGLPASFGRRPQTTRRHPTLHALIHYRIFLAPSDSAQEMRC